VGNVGQNSLMQASDEYPVYITAKDFDKSGAYSAIPSIFLLDKDGVKKNFRCRARRYFEADDQHEEEVHQLQIIRNCNNG
jgi:hypothetical protein